jgi:nucleotide-binding universal stress UspA family protein
MLSKPNILVCTDFSANALEALEAAEKIRRQTHGTLHALHVSPHTTMWDWLPRDGFPPVDDSKFEVDLLERLNSKLQLQMQSVQAIGQGVISMGNPSNVILEEARAKKIDLIVLGHQGTSAGLFHLGSVAQKVIGSSSVPVLVVKKPLQIDRIAALVDPNGIIAPIVNWAEEMAFLFSAHLSVVSLFPDLWARYIGVLQTPSVSQAGRLSEGDRETIISVVTNRISSVLSKNINPSIRVDVTAEKKIAYHLNSIMEEEKIDLVIMKRHQTDFVEKILIGSETRRMIEIFKGNLIILPA